MKETLHVGAFSTCMRQPDKHDMMVIQKEIKQGLNQKQIALSYAMAIRSEAANMDAPDWAAINGAILTRWKMSGLERIKKRAFDILRGKVQL